MIDQNTIISMLNDVVPQMQKSKDPETTLLKYAKEQNLPPSVLERMAHAFNQLKTNCYMDAADSMEKRGSQFSLIDSPELVKKYTKFAGENIGKDFGKVAQDAASFWDILVNKESNLLKAASETASVQEASLEELTNELPGEKIFNDFVKAAFASEIESVKDNATEKKEHFVDTYIENKKSLENLDDYITSLQFKRASIVENTKKILRYSDNELEKFASYENDAIILDSDVAKIKDAFVNEIVYKNSYLADNIKRASEKLTKHLIKDIHPITQAFIDYSDTLKCLDTANSVKLAAAKDPNDPELLAADKGLAELLDGAFDEVDSGNSTNKTDTDASDQQQADTDDASKGVAPNIPKADKVDPNAAILVNTLSQQVQNANTKDSKGKDEKSNAENTDKGSNNDRIYKALNNNLDKLETSFNKGLDNLGSLNKSLFNLALSTTKKQHSDFGKTKTKLYNKISDALFQKMMMTDPILSKLDPADTGSIIEAYKSYKQQYPEIAFQPALLKSVLRGAAQVDGGEDISALKELTSARKNLAQARTLEV